MNDAVLQVFEFGPPPWPTIDPFLFCVHHVDHYPAGDQHFAPVEPLTGRNIGNDFSNTDGWSMYHGSTVPGFPQHPHRGFETITFVGTGLIDHSDSLGAAARYGNGDVQWMTAGAGIVHAEMFPLLNQAGSNPAEFFQIWLNLPAADKFARPHFSMLWAEHVPVVRVADEAGRASEITVAAGALGDHVPPAPPPESWASRADSDVAIWRIRMEAGASWTMPASNGADTLRVLYVFHGEHVTVGGHAARSGTGCVLSGPHDIELVAGTSDVEMLLLQGRPIGEPVAQYGPFVMNDREGFEQAFEDYRRTGFGGWPWGVNDPVHGRAGRFARHADGRIETPPGDSGAPEPGLDRLAPQG